MQHSLDSMIADERGSFAFGRFTHDPQRILAAVHRLALVRIELCFHVSPFELRIASHADAQNGFPVFSLYDPELALEHDSSLAHWRGRRKPCGNQTAPLPEFSVKVDRHRIGKSFCGRLWKMARASGILSVIACFRQLRRVSTVLDADQVRKQDLTAEVDFSA